MGQKGRKVTLPSEEGQVQGLSTPFAPALTLEVCGHPETPEPGCGWNLREAGTGRFYLSSLGSICVTWGWEEDKAPSWWWEHVEGHPTIIGASGPGLVP